SELAVARAGNGATATFVQTWSAPESGYRDVGRKTMVLMPENGALHIVREEMLESRLGGAARAGPDGERVAVVAVGRGVLTTETIEPWSTGAPARARIDGRAQAVVRKVDAAKLPAPLRAWKGRRVRLYDFSGQVCEGTISAFEHLRRVIPHFYELQ